jgi:hypothetical protein
VIHCLRRDSEAFRARRGQSDRRAFQLYVDLEERARRNHPSRAIRAIVNDALAALKREFAALYSPIGRPSIPPEKLLRTMLLQAFYSLIKAAVAPVDSNQSFTKTGHCDGKRSVHA